MKIDAKIFARKILLNVEFMCVLTIFVFFRFLILNAELESLFLKFKIWTCYAMRELNMGKWINMFITCEKSCKSIELRIFLLNGFWGDVQDVEKEEKWEYGQPEVKEKTVGVSCHNWTKTKKSFVTLSRFLIQLSHKLLRCRFNIL